MNESIKRSITTGQPKMRMLCIDVDTTNVKANGFDANKILSVAKTAVGKYTITLKFPFNKRR